MSGNLNMEVCRCLLCREILEFLNQIHKDIERIREDSSSDSRMNVVISYLNIQDDI